MSYHCINGEHGCRALCYDVRPFDDDYWFVVLQCSCMRDADDPDGKQITCKYTAKTQDDITWYSPRIVHASFGSNVRAPQWCPKTRPVIHLGD